MTGLPPNACRLGRSCASAARHSRRRRRRTQDGPDATTNSRNLYLAGDWTDTGLPATIEGAIRSGNRAADLVLHHIRRSTDAAMTPMIRHRRCDDSMRWNSTSAPRRDAMLAEQQADGHWVFELEADATIPAEYVLMVHYFGEPSIPSSKRKIGVYLRRIQGAHGGWPLFHEGDFDMSASVKAYFALKMIGDDIKADTCDARARRSCRAAAREQVNVFTRCAALALRRAAWRSVPVMPVEIMLLPKWFPFHLDKISYWARTVIVPLLVLQALKPRARNPRACDIDELFLEPPQTIGAPHKAPHQKWSWFCSSAPSTSCCAPLEPLFPKGPRKRAIDRRSRSSPSGSTATTGSARSIPAMANSVKMYRRARLSAGPSAARHRARSLDKLLVVKDDEAYCQPCVSPVWDTALVCQRCWKRAARGRSRSQQGPRLAQAAAGARREGRLDRAAPERAARRLGIPVQQRALSRSRRHRGGRDGDGSRARRARHSGIRRGDRARAANGSWACRATTAAGARSTPTTRTTISTTFRSPTTARCSIRRPRMSPPAACRCWRNSASAPERIEADAPRDRMAARALSFPRAAGIGRWGMNYIYGTWSVLCALNAAGVDHQAPMSARRSMARRRSRIRTAAGARTARATSSTTAATSRRRAPPRRRHGRCLA